MNVFFVYSVFDKVAKNYNLPVFLASDDVAKRQVRAVAMDGDSMFARFPDDFKLVRLGSVDLSRGCIVPLDEPVVVCDGFKQLLTAVNDGGEL